MTAKMSSASFEMGVRSAPATETTACQPGGPLTILLLGDYTGRPNRGVSEPLQARKPMAVDTDNFEQVFARLDARLKLLIPTLPGGETEISFSSLQAFHPDQLLKDVVPLANFAEARRKLSDPAKAAQGEAALKALLSTSADKSAAKSPASGTSPLESDDETLARLLGGAPSKPKHPATPASAMDQFIRQVVTPHVSPADPGGKAGALAAAEMEMTNRLNGILHHPDFQALEAAWRGVDLLVRRIESSEEIRLLLLDVSLTELQSDLSGSGAAEESGLFRLLHHCQPRLVIGNYTFGQTADDLHTLSRIAAVAAQLSAPFIAAGASQLVGSDSFARHPDPDDWRMKLPADLAEVWGGLRRSPHARFVALAAPRFLLRQPYGKSGDSIETFPFEELPAEPVHGSFLWGQPALLCAAAAIDAFQAGDTELAEFTGGAIGDLPVHKFIVDGETEVKSYAEAWLTDRAVDRMLTLGILPVIPVKNQNVVRLNHLNSVALLRTPLPVS